MSPRRAKCGRDALAGRRVSDVPWRMIADTRTRLPPCQALLLLASTRLTLPDNLTRSDVSQKNSGQRRPLLRRTCSVRLGINPVRNPVRKSPGPQWMNFQTKFCAVSPADWRCPKLAPRVGHHVNLLVLGSKSTISSTNFALTDVVATDDSQRRQKSRGLPSIIECQNKPMIGVRLSS